MWQGAELQRSRVSHKMSYGFCLRFVSYPRRTLRHHRFPASGRSLLTCPLVRFRHVTTLLLQLLWTKVSLR